MTCIFSPRTALELSTHHKLVRHRQQHLGTHNAEDDGRMMTADVSSSIRHLEALLVMRAPRRIKDQGMSLNEALLPFSPEASHCELDGLLFCCTLSDTDEDLKGSPTNLGLYHCYQGDGRWFLLHEKATVTCNFHECTLSLRSFFSVYPPRMNCFG